MIGPANTLNSAFIAVVHAVSLAVLAWSAFSPPRWPTVALAVVWSWCSGISITGGYHRLFSHRSYRCARPVTLFYLLFGGAAVQNSALTWASDHRRHHADTDGDTDPYDARRGLWWSHIGWVFRDNPARDYANVRDLASDRLVAWQHRYYLPIAIGMAGAVPGVVAFAWGDPLGGVLWCGCIRLVAQYHSTFAINSIAHRFGRQPVLGRHVRARQRPRGAADDGRGVSQLSPPVSVRLPERRPVVQLRPDEMARERAVHGRPHVGPEALGARSRAPGAPRETPCLTLSRPPTPCTGTSSARRTVESLLERAGVRTDGARPWDIRVRDERFFQRVLADADLGLGESYMDGDWDCEQLDELSARLFRADLDRVSPRAVDVFNALVARVVTRQTPGQVHRHVAPHYNLGNDLFEAMLDTRHMATRAPTGARARRRWKRRRRPSWTWCAAS